MLFKRSPPQKQDLKDHRMQLKWNIAEFFPKKKNQPSQEHWGGGRHIIGKVYSPDTPS